MRNTSTLTATVIALALAACSLRAISFTPDKDQPMHANADASVPDGADGPGTAQDSGIDAAVSPPPFTIRSFTPEFWDITYGSGIFVAVGGAGYVATSPDGMTWTLRQTPTEAFLQGVAFGNGRFVAAAVNDGYLVSSDGLSWQQPDRSVTFHCVEFLNGAFVGVDSYSLRTSPDGISWSSPQPIPAGYIAGNISYGNGTYVLTAEARPSNMPGVFSSTTLIDWSEFRQQPEDFNHIAFGNGIFLGTGVATFYTSSDGIMWSSRFVNSITQGADFIGDQFIVPGDGTVTATRDGNAATTSVASAGVEILRAAAGNGTVIVAVGTEIQRSSDAGATWAKVSASPATRLSDVAASDGTPGIAQFVAVGSRGRILATFDGAIWQDTGFVDDPIDIRGVTFGNGTWIATTFSGQIYTSSTGELWTKQPGNNAGQLITFGNGLFVSVVAGTDVRTSSDGVTWSVSVYTFPAQISTLSYRAGLFFATSVGTIYTSQDARTWAPHVVTGAPGTPWLYVVYGNGLFGATSRGRFIARSSDGVNWSAVDWWAATGRGTYTYLLVFDGSHFVVEEYGGDAGHDLFSTTDLLNFSLLTHVGNQAGFFWNWAWNGATSSTRTAAISDQSFIMTMP